MAVATWRASSLFVLALGLACSAPAAPFVGTAQPTPTPAPAIAEPDTDADAGPAVSEVDARALLNRMFRDAGLRIVNDHVFRRPDIEVTLDGYDPERGIGYEYIATEEQGTDLTSAELTALEAHEGIFAASAGSFDQLEAAAQAFLTRASAEISEL